MEGKRRGGRGRRIRRRERIYASENSLIGCVRVVYVRAEVCVDTCDAIETSERIEKKEKKKKAKTRN